MYDPDEFAEKRPEIAELDRLLARLQDCDLSSWDQDFVDDMTRRLEKQGNNLRVSALQQEQLHRMEKQYGI